MEYFADYQKEAAKTAVYREAIEGLEANDQTSEMIRLVYPALGLAGEAGELVNKVKKLVRGDTSLSNFFFKASLVDELGDVLWYVSALCDELGYSMADVAQMNLEKLAERAEAGTIKGSGDKR